MAGISRKKIKTKKGIEIKYTITYRDVYGKQHTSGIYNTQKDAKKHLADFNNKKIDNDKITFGMLINYFMEKVNKKYSKSTKEEYQRYIENDLKKFLDIKYQKLDTLIFQNFFDDIEKQTPFTAYNMLKFCKAVVNYCMKPPLKLVDFNIFKDIEPIKLPDSKKQNITLNDAIVLLEKCTVCDNWFFAILFTFILNGMREGELFALNKSDFNFSNGTIRINKQYTNSEYKEKTKTDKSNRFIYMLPIYQLFAEIYLSTVDTDLVFPNMRGGYLHPSNIRQRHFQKLLIKCGYEYNYTSIHKLRAFFIDLMFYMGVAGKFTQGQVGHAKYETTYNNYASSNASIIDASLAQVSEGMGLEFRQKIYNKKELYKTFKRILEKWIEYNDRIQDKSKELRKIDNFFAKKCEQNVSKREKSPDKKIIQFPQRKTGLIF